MTATTPDRAAAQAAFDDASFTMPIESHFAGRPDCPACLRGVLVMVKTVMAYDASGDFKGYHSEDGSARYPVEPTGCYTLRVMTCRREHDEAGCGFATPLERPSFMCALPEGIAVLREPVKLDD